MTLLHHTWTPEARQPLSISTQQPGRIVFDWARIRPCRAMTLQPGSLVRLANRPGRTYQVVNLDEFSDCVWVRSWPLCAQRNPTFSVSIGQVAEQLLDFTGDRQRSELTQLPAHL
jgi:hypothetical protein